MTHFEVQGRPLREGVGRNGRAYSFGTKVPNVALYARAWVEIIRWMVMLPISRGRPLREGVGRNSFV